MYLVITPVNPSAALSSGVEREVRSADEVLSRSTSYSAMTAKRLSATRVTRLDDVMAGHVDQAPHPASCRS